MEVNQFRTNLIDRLESRLLEESFEEMTVGGSMLRFEMAMAITGDSIYEPLLTTEQYHSGIYEIVIEEVFNRGLQMSQNK